jgi:hypothetical protein
MNYRFTDPRVPGTVASFDTEGSSLTLRNVEIHEAVTLDDWECDNLLRVIDYSPTPDQADADIAEFFTDTTKNPMAARRFAMLFTAIAPQLENFVYDTEMP